jgi:hypothetical protein
VDPDLICVGGAAVRLSGDLEARPPAAGFGSPPGHDVRVLDLHVTRDPVPDPERPEPVFESTGLWKVLRRGSEHVFELPHLTAVVDFEARVGTIHLHDPGAAAFVFDYPLDEVIFSRLLADRSSVIVHACGVEHAGRGLLFAGNSGAGKSTLAGLYDEREDARVLSDDRVVVALRGGGACIEGTPWHGTAGHAADLSVSLERIFFLRHAPSNELQPLGPTEAAARLTSMCVVPYWHGAASRAAVDVAVEVGRTVRASVMGFVPDLSAVELVGSSLSSRACCDIQVGTREE